MRAVVYDRYGPPDVLRLGEVEPPVPKKGEVLVRVRAAAVTRTDCHIRDANHHNGRLAETLSRLATGVRGPRRRILGGELAGEVLATGTAVQTFKAGDAVFASAGLAFGGWAELACVPAAGRIARKPDNATFELAAAITDGGLQANGLLPRSGLREGQTILVYGASGAIGSAAVQLAARHIGARVTAVCGTKSLELMPALGAEHVIDYTAEDFTRNGERYDVIFDAVGKHSFARSKASLLPGGRFLATDGFRNLWLMIATTFRPTKVVFLPPMPTRSDTELLAQLVEHKIYTPVIDRCYPLDRVVEAVRYVETEQKTGNVILDVTSGNTA